MGAPVGGAWRRRDSMRRTARVGLGAVCVVGVLVVASSVATARVTAAKPVPVKAWSGSVCQDFGRWQARLAVLTPTVLPADPAAGKAAITKFVKGAVTATATLAGRLESAGVPEIKDGAAIAAAFTSSVESLRGAYRRARTAAAALPTADRAAFATATHALAVQLQAAASTLSATVAQAAAQYPASALDQAFSSTKACAAIA